MALIESPSALRKRGFTLIELSLVLLIIGVVISLLMPSLRDRSVVELEATARRFGALARYLRSEAALTGRFYRLNYDLPKGIYWVTVLSVAGEVDEFVEDSSPLARRVSLPGHVSFADVIIPPLGKTSEGETFTHFYPNGAADATTIHLGNGRGRFYTIVIPPAVGEPQIFDRYVDIAVPSP